jgi:hypothetical protein
MEAGWLLLGVLLILVVGGWGWIANVSPRPKPARARVKPHAGQMEYLERRELLDAGLGGELQLLEGESIVINGEVIDNVDMMALAQAISASGARFFGAVWCPVCTQQKQLFGDAAKYLPFIEVTHPNRTLNQVGIDNNISQFPTWEFADGTREVGVLSIATLIARTGITEVPTGTTPYLEHIADIEMYAGEAVHIPLNGYTPTGQPLTYTVTTGSGQTETIVLQQNRSLRITSPHYGVMEFQLFEDLAPVVTSQIIHLAQSGFYDGLTFHRVIHGFMVQGGDPKGDGSGGRQARTGPRA